MLMGWLAGLFAALLPSLPAECPDAPVSAIRESVVVELVEGGGTELDVVIDSFSFIELLLTFIAPLRHSPAFPQ